MRPLGPRHGERLLACYEVRLMPSAASYFLPPAAFAAIL